MYFFRIRDGSGRLGTADLGRQFRLGDAKTLSGFAHPFCKSECRLSHLRLHVTDCDGSGGALSMNSAGELEANDAEDDQPDAEDPRPAERFAEDEHAGGSHERSA